MRRRFFGVVKEAFRHWPHGYYFQPDDAEHLRAWLLAQAGFKTQTEIPHKGLEPKVVSAIAAAVIKASGKQSFPAVHNGRIYVITPKSIKKIKSSHRELVGVFELVENKICEVLGIESCDQLLKEKEQAA